MNESNFKISMDHSAHYVTQSSVYECPLLGKLTNRRITKYQKQGRYGTPPTQLKPKTKRIKKTDTLAKLMKELFA